MVFIMRYLSSKPSNLMKRLMIWTFSAVILLSGQSGAVASQISHSLNHQQLLMQGELAVALPDDIRQAIKQEIPILFVTRIQLEQQRDFIFFNLPKQLTQVQYQTELHYSHFYQTFTLHNLRNGNRLAFSQLDEALKVLGRFQDFPLTDLSQLHAGLNYRIVASIGIDWRRLSAPLFNHALFNQAWQYNTGLISHSITLGPAT